MPVKTLSCSSVISRFLRMHAVLLLALGRRSAAPARFEQILQRSPLDCHALASRAHVYAEQGNFAEAVRSFRRLTQSRPQEPAGWFNLGYALQQIGHQGEASVAFRRALAIEPRMYRAWYGLALVLMDARLFEGAAEALAKNRALQPMSAHGWFRLARVRQALGQRDEAFKIVAHLGQFEPKVAAQLEQVLGVHGMPADIADAAHHAA